MARWGFIPQTVERPPHHYSGEAPEASRVGNRRAPRTFLTWETDEVLNYADRSVPRPESDVAAVVGSPSWIPVRRDRYGRARQFSEPREAPARLGVPV